MTAASAVATAIAGFLAPRLDGAFSDAMIWGGVAAMIIPAVVFAYVLPRLRVGFMATVWRLPRRTFLCSRPLVRLVGSTIIGTLLSAIALAFVLGGIYHPILSLVAPAASSFFYSAIKRFQRHPQTEFAMPLQYFFRVQV